MPCWLKLDDPIEANCQGEPAEIETESLGWAPLESGGYLLNRPGFRRRKLPQAAEI